MELSENILIWVEKMNPSLLMIQEKGQALKKPSQLVVEEDVSVVIVEGVDSVFHQKALDLGKKVLLIEKDQGKIKTFLEEGFVPHDNLFIATDQKEELFPILKKFVFQKIQMVGELSFIDPYLGGMEMSFSEYRNLGKDILPNILSNLVHVQEAIDGRDLAGIFEGEEVIVCGSGISLEDAIEELQKMHFRPFIIATGSSINTLLENGIIPDFFAAVDPLPIGDTFSCLENLSIPIFYQNRVSRDLLWKHSGPKVFMGSSAGWQVEESLMHEMGRENFFFDAGCNAGNFGAHIALALGCKKLILVGMDGIAKEEEEGEIKEFVRTRADLFYGMDFFQTLAENFSDREVAHFTLGLSFKSANKIDSIAQALPKSKQIEFPDVQAFDVQEAKKVIDRYFDHTIKEDLEDFLQTSSANKREKDALCACLLAEFSLEPLYLNFIVPLWEVWKYLIPHAEDVYAKLSFFYTLVKSISKKTGFVHGEFFLFGEKEGLFEEIDKNNVCRSKKYFYKGKEQGFIETFDEKGALLCRQQMKEGKRDGLYQVFLGGKVVREGVFVHGLPHGIHRCFYDGRVIDEVAFDHGKKCGVHKKFSLGGYKRSEIVYREKSDLFNTYLFDEQGQKSYEAIWQGSSFFMRRFEKGREVFAQEGKMVGGKVVFREEQ